MAARTSPAATIIFTRTRFVWPLSAGPPPKDNRRSRVHVEFHSFESGFAQPDSFNARRV
jgi:hypothetical protein